MFLNNLTNHKDPKQWNYTQGGTTLNLFQCFIYLKNTSLQIMIRSAIYKLLYNFGSDIALRR